MCGLRNVNKRREVFLHLKQKADIVCLQETHSCNKTNDHQVWQNEYGSKIVMSHGESNSRGVLVAISKRLDIDILNIDRDNAGRYVIINFVSNLEKYTLVNLYAPNSDTPTFFTEIFHELEKYEGKRILIGDFNLAINAQIDRTSAKGDSANNEKSAKTVCAYMEDTFMTDPWRDRNENVARYTFRKKKPHYVASHIDFVLTDHSIAKQVSKVDIMYGYKSDHSAVYLKVDQNLILRGKGYWKFNDKLLYEKEFVEALNASLEGMHEQISELNPIDKWEMVKLKCIEVSREYALKRASSRKLIIAQLEENINKMEQECSDSPLLNKSKQDLHEMIEETTRGAMFRSKAKWYNKGEKPTKYFLNLEKARSGSKSMSVLINDNEQELTAPAEILQEQAKFYRKLYKSDASTSFDYINEAEVKLEENEKLDLDKPLTLQELTTALKSTNQNSSPGCDGLTTKFYIVFWNKLGSMLHEACLFSYDQGQLYSSALKGIITLISKKQKDSRRVQNMRPISLLCTCYKLIEKVIANRIKPHLEKLIHEDQKGFMKSRRISSNIRCILDIMHQLERQEEEGVVISIDFCKCFDKIERVAIKGAMRYFNFGEGIIRWIDLLYKNSASQVINNGFLSAPIPIERSVKQGGPASPYFFLLIAEVLAIELRNNRIITGFYAGEFRKLFGQYADDINLFCKNDKKNFNEIDRTMSLFCSQTGCSINYDKTTVYRIGKYNESVSKVYTVKEMQVVQNSINVLGINIWASSDKMLEENYKELVDKTTSTLMTWSNRQLSLFAKITVMNSLIASLFVYRMYILPRIPARTVKQLNKICEKFIWNGRRPKIGLNKLQNAKSKGGLNLVDFKLKDDSLKLSWIPYLLTDRALADIAYQQLAPELKENIWHCNLSPDDISCIGPKKHFQTHNFWKEVLETWCEFNYQPLDDCNPGNEIVWLNSHIKVGGKPVLWKQCYRSGLMYVNQLFVNSKIISAEEAKRKFAMETLCYNSLITALPRMYKEYFKAGEENVQPEVCNYDRICHWPKPASKFYKLKQENHLAMFATYTRWQANLQSNLDYDSFLKLFRNIYIITNHSKLRSMQYRILNMALVLNEQLYNWKIVTSPMCTFCKESPENQMHMYTRCREITKFFPLLKEIVDSYYPTNMAIAFTPQNILFNTLTTNPNDLVNFVLLAFKTHVYSYRCLKKGITKESVINYIENCRKCEYYNAKRTHNTKKYYKKWYNLKGNKAEDYTQEYLTDIVIDTFN